MIYLNGSPINVTKFPDNTSQVWKLPKDILEQTNYAHVVWDFQDEGEFMQLTQLKALLDLYKFKATLRLKYLPYGRQDKSVSNEATFALHSFAYLLNSLNFDEVVCIDPHSNVAEDSIKNFKAVYPTSEVWTAKYDTKADVFCYPDSGALHKYVKIYDHPHIYGKKLRDQSTGNISNYLLVGECKDESVLIVDDICDGGKTFILLAEALLKGGAKDVNLFVSHGIFSKGLKVIKDAGINRIFTKNGEVSEHQGSIVYRS